MRAGVRHSGSTLDVKGSTKSQLKFPTPNPNQECGGTDVNDGPDYDNRANPKSRPATLHQPSF